jgi:hypothetical protein
MKNSYENENFCWRKTMIIQLMQKSRYCLQIQSWTIKRFNRFACNCNIVAIVFRYFDWFFRFDYQFLNEKSWKIYIWCRKFCKKFVIQKTRIENFDQMLWKKTNHEYETRIEWIFLSWFQHSCFRFSLYKMHNDVFY